MRCNEPQHGLQAEVPAASCLDVLVVLVSHADVLGEGLLGQVGLFAEGFQSNREKTDVVVSNSNHARGFDTQARDDTLLKYGVLRCGEIKLPASIFGSFSDAALSFFAALTFLRTPFHRSS